MYDAVAQAVRLTTTGQHRKKALVLLSDGNDTTSKTSLRELKQLIRESEALVYAIGIDCGTDASSGATADHSSNGAARCRCRFPSRLVVAAGRCRRRGHRRFRRKGGRGLKAAAIRSTSERCAT